MGLLDFLKPKKKENLTYKVKVSAYENGKEVLLEDETNNIEESRLIEQYCRVHDTVQPYENIIVGFATALKEKHSIDGEIELLTALIAAYNDFKNKCRVLGVDYLDYFYEEWENARKNKPDGPSYVTRYENRLAYIKENYARLKTNENRRREAIPNLESNVISLIENNQPILQTDIYKHFDPSVTNDIKEMLYLADKSQKIRREKSGRTYLISLK